MSTTTIFSSISSVKRFTSVPCVIRARLRHLRRKARRFQDAMDRWAHDPPSLRKGHGVDGPSSFRYTISGPTPVFQSPRKRLALALSSEGLAIFILMAILCGVSIPGHQFQKWSFEDWPPVRVPLKTICWRSTRKETGAVIHPRLIGGAD